jgi:frataxin-like iron-binding protein CyaY
MSSDWSEKDYRIEIKSTYDRVEKKYSEYDPDVLEVESGLGTLVLQSKKAKIILSTQPSVRQLWLAAAHLGKALHFNYDHQKKQWWDDKGLGIELDVFLKDTVESLLNK